MTKWEALALASDGDAVAALHLRSVQHAAAGSGTAMKGDTDPAFQWHGVVAYRYEHPETGAGPYVDTRLPQNVRDQMGQEHSGCDCHPGPWNDFHIENFLVPEYAAFGMLTEKALRRWFIGYNVALEAAGYQVVAYECAAEGTQVSQRTSQVMFYKPLAKKLPSGQASASRQTCDENSQGI